MCARVLGACCVMLKFKCLLSPRMEGRVAGGYSDLGWGAYHHDHLPPDCPAHPHAPPSPFLPSFLPPPPLLSSYGLFIFNPIIPCSIPQLILAPPLLSSYFLTMAFSYPYFNPIIPCSITQLIPAPPLLSSYFLTMAFSNFHFSPIIKVLRSSCPLIFSFFQLAYQFQLSLKVQFYVKSFAFLVI